MLQSSDDPMSIVVLEAGAVWPAWLAEYQRLAPNAVVIAQARAETPVAFRGRVVHRITEATGSGKARVRVGVIVAGDGGEESTSVREAIARAILKLMKAGSEAELMLAGEGQESDRAQLFSLAGVLCQGLGGTGVSVKVRFSSARSGVMRSVSASLPEPEKAATKGGA